jgi:hypothetical protein
VAAALEILIITVAAEQEAAVMAARDSLTGQLKWLPSEQ